MVKLKRLKIEKYRNVKPGTELRFRDSLNVMLGRNGTGKTTLLNLIVQLLSWDFSKLHEEAASLEYDLHTSEVELTVRFRTEVLRESVGGADTQPPSGKLLTMGLVQTTPRYTTILEIDIVRPGEKPWVLRSEGAMLTLSEQGERSQTIAAERSLMGEQALITILETLLFAPTSKQLQNLLIALAPASELWLLFLKRFDESLWYFDQVVERESMSAMRFSKGSDRYTVVPDGPTPFVQHLENALGQNPEIGDVGIESKDEGQEFLQRLVELLGFESAQVRLQRIARSADPSPGSSSETSNSISPGGMAPSSITRS
ncbi:AAA family ATPase [Cystobacter fuscus]